MSQQVDWSAITRGMSEWALEAQAEYDASYIAMCETKSTDPIESEECGWYWWIAGACEDATDERAKCKAYHDPTWIVVNVDGMTTGINIAQTYEDKMHKFSKFVYLAENDPRVPYYPSASANWKNKVPVPVQSNVPTYQPGGGGGNGNGDGNGLTTGTKAMIFAGAALSTVTVLSLMSKKNEEIPERFNPAWFLALPAVWKAAVIAGGVLATAGAGAAIGTGLGYAIYGDIKLVDKDVVIERATDLISRVRGGDVYGGMNSKTMILNRAGYSNSMRICASSNDLETAKYQQAYFMALTGYILGDKSYGDRAQALIDSNAGFNSPTEAESTMRSFLAEMESSSDSRVRDMAIDYTLITRGTCMDETARGELLLTEGASSCPTITRAEFALETVEGLLFLRSPRRPCRMPLKKWKKIQLYTYVPLGLGMLYLTAPFLKIGGKLVERAIDE